MGMFKKTAIYSAFLAIIFISGKALAASPRVASPYVEKDERRVQWQGYYAIDKNVNKSDAWKQKALLGGALTDSIKGNIRVGFENSGYKDDGNTNFKSVGGDLTFQFAPKGEYFIDSGIKFDYEHYWDEEDPDVISGRLLFGKEIGQFQHLLNARVDHGLGGDKKNEWGGGLSWSTKYSYSVEFQPGFEIYNELGKFNKMPAFRDMDRSAGPVVSGKIAGIKYHTGYIFGLSDSATDGVAKLSFEYEF